MKDKLEVGMYVRIQWGNGEQTISKCTNKVDMGDTQYSLNDFYIHTDQKGEVIYKSMILKASYNIIDLIKPKDIILGNDGKLYQCWKVYKDYVFTYSKNKQGLTITLVDYQIDRVMCYEQFESMSYKLGDNK